MPQLDFFIFSHIVIQSTVVFFFLLLLVYNDFLVKIFKSLKTRKYFLDLISDYPIIEELRKNPRETYTTLNQLEKNIQTQKNTIRQDLHS